MKNIPETNAPWIYTYDKITGVEYFKVRNRASSKQRVLREGLIVDCDEEDNVVGIEIVEQENKTPENAKKEILQELLKKTENGGFAPPWGAGSASGSRANSAVRQWAENKLKEL